MSLNVNFPNFLKYIVKRISYLRNNYISFHWNNRKFSLFLFLHLHTNTPLICVINPMKFLRNPHINLQRVPLGGCCRTGVPDPFSVLILWFSLPFLLEIYLIIKIISAVWHLRNTKMGEFPELPSPFPYCFYSSLSHLIKLLKSMSVAQGVLIYSGFQIKLPLSMYTVFWSCSCLQLVSTSRKKRKISAGA